MECDHPISLVQSASFYHCVCMHVCVRAHEWTCMLVCGGHRLILSIIQELFTVFSVSQGLSLEPGVTDQCRLSGQGAPGVPPVFPLQG